MSLLKRLRSLLRREDLDVDLDEELKFPNGVTLSPDQSLLYVAESRTHWVYSYQVQPDGRALGPAAPAGPTPAEPTSSPALSSASATRPRT